MAETTIPPGYEQTTSGLVIPTTLKATDALSDLRHPTAWLTDWAGGRTTSAGLRVSHQSAMSLPTYYACIRAISEDVGKLPLITYRRLTPRGKERAYDHPNYELLHTTPNEDMEALTFRETLQAWALAWGNGYAEIERNSRGEALALHPLHPSRVLIRRDEMGRIVYDVHGAEMIAGALQTTMVRLRSENVFHLRGLGSEGLYGYSILQFARESLGLSLAAQEVGSSFLANGMSISGVLQHPHVLTDTASTHLRESWKSMYSGSGKAGGLAILEEGMQYTPISIPPNQAQYLETRVFQVRDIARWFRMPLHKIQDMADASFNNIEHQSLDYLTDTLMPWCVRWEQQIQRKLFHNDANHFAEFLYVGLLRGDAKARSLFLRTMFGLAALSPNDIREAENMNPIGPAGDTYFIMGNNLIPIEQAIRQPQQALEIPEDDEDERDEDDSESMRLFTPHVPPRAERHEESATPAHNEVHHG